MPLLASAVAAYFVVSTAMAYMIIAMAVVTLASVAYSAYMMANMKTPGSASDAATRMQTLRSAVQPHRVIYGLCKTGGVLVYAESHGENNKYITLVVCFASHEVDEILEVILNDRVSTDLTFTLHTDAIPEESYATEDGTVTITSPGVAATDEPYVTVTKYTGTQTQTADPLLVGLPSGLWTANHTLTGRAYAVVTIRQHETMFPTGLPNITAFIRGNNQIYDPATATTGYSNNWALCVRDYLTKPYGLNAPAADINETAAIAARNICAETVELARANISDEILYEPRYTLNGSFTVDNTPTSIINEMLAAAYGAITWTQGQYRIIPAAYYAPDMTFHGLNAAIPGLTESDLRGPIKVRPRSSMKDKFNTVKGTYISRITWHETDFPTVTNALYVAEDGAEIVKDIQLSYITSPSAAQRIAKIILEKSRQGIVVDFPAQWSAFPLTVGDTVPITIAQLGWSQKIFTVRDWAMSSDGGVDLQLQEEASGIYAWDNAEETMVDLAPDTNLADPRFVTIPTGLTAGEEIYSTNVPSILKSRAIITWSDSGAAQYEINYFPPNNTIWAPLPFTTDTTCVVDDVIPGDYVFRVRAMNHLGVWSYWAPYLYKTILGKRIYPVNATALTQVLTGDTVVLAWTASAAPDIAHYEIRVGASWAAGTLVHSTPATSYSFKPSASGSAIYWLSALDTSGNYSATAIGVTVTVPTPDTPSSISGLSTDTGVNLTLTFSQSMPSVFCEIYSSSTNDRSTAALDGTTTTNFFINKNHAEEVTRYYWIRTKNNFGDVSGYFPSGATAGVAIHRYATVYDQSTAPANPIEGLLWRDTSTTPVSFKVYVGGTWVNAATYIGSLGVTTELIADFAVTKRVFGRIGAYSSAVTNQILAGGGTYSLSVSAESSQYSDFYVYLSLQMASSSGGYLYLLRNYTSGDPTSNILARLPYAPDTAGIFILSAPEVAGTTSLTLYCTGTGAPGYYGFVEMGWKGFKK